MTQEFGEYEVHLEIQGHHCDDLQVMVKADVFGAFFSGSYYDPPESPEVDVSAITCEWDEDTVAEFNAENKRLGLAPLPFKSGDDLLPLLTAKQVDAILDKVYEDLQSIHEEGYY